MFRLALACIPFLAAGCGQHGAQTPDQQPNQGHEPTLKILGPEPSKHSTGLLGDWGAPHRGSSGADSDFGLHSRTPRGGWFTFPGRRRASVDPTARYSSHKPR